MNQKKLVLGSFDAEKFWKSKNCSELPHINDQSADNIVACMDELLFPICGEGDVLITRFALPQALKQYLEHLGFKFLSNKDSITADTDYYNSKDECIFELLCEHKKDNLASLISEAGVLEPYAVLPKLKKACETYGFEYNQPDIDTVIKVNSKVYSHELHERVGLQSYGSVVKNSREIEAVAELFSNGKGFLIKDNFGVSGKGNFHINTRGILKRIVKYLEEQESKGFETCLIVEPYLEKEIDFSCQLTIDPNGQHQIVSIQKILNSGFSYSGAVTADKSFTEYLESRGYFILMDKVAAELFRDGYYGNVCIDSMILKDNQIVPIVEINARKSMGLINFHMDEFLKRFSAKGNFAFLSVGFKGLIQMDDVLAKLKSEKLLFGNSGQPGVLPMSSNTLFINRDIDCSYNSEKFYKGRIYFTVVSNKAEERSMIMDNLREALRALAFTVYA